MIADKAYAYDLSVPEIVPEYKPSKRDFKIVKAPSKAQSRDTNNTKNIKRKH